MNLVFDIATVLGLLALFGAAAVVLAVLLALVAPVIADAVSGTGKQGRPAACGTEQSRQDACDTTTEVNMKGRFALVSCLAIAFILLGTLPGCQSWRGFDVDMALVTDDGRTFEVHRTPAGVDIAGEFVEPKTGLIFVLGEGIGNITARDPRTGLQITIKPKYPEPEPDPAE